MCTKANDAPAKRIGAPSAMDALSAATNASVRCPPDNETKKPLASSPKVSTRSPTMNESDESAASRGSGTSERMRKPVSRSMSGNRCAWNPARRAARYRLVSSM